MNDLIKLTFSSLSVSWFILRASSWLKAAGSLCPHKNTCNRMFVNTTVSKFSLYVMITNLRIFVCFSTEKDLCPISDATHFPEHNVG